MWYAIISIGLEIAGSSLVAVTRPPAESLPLLRELGFTRVELAFHEGWTTVGPRGLAKSQTSVLRRGLKSSGLVAVALNIGVEGLSPAPARHALDDCLTLAHALKISVVTVQAEPVLDLNDLVQAADRVGVMLAVETHVGYLTESTDSTLGLLAAVSDLGLTLDLSHYAFLGLDLESPEIEALIRRADHVHYRDAAPGALQLTPGEGVLDPESFTDRLAGSGYSRNLTVEYIDAPEDAAAARSSLERALLARKA